MKRLLSLTVVCALCAWLCAATPALAAHSHTATTHSTTTRAKVTHTTKTHPKATHATATHGAASKVTDAEGLKVLNDCQQHGQFTQDWTHAELEKARSLQSAMTNEYSSCANDIQQALATGIKTRPGSGGSGGGSGTTIVIIIAAVLVALAALLGALALRRRGQSGEPPPSAA